ncbi:MAG: VPLPA-CTERM sorting domain-containing protein [Gammaproteobacteria bacterium]|nr:VPLPA-CTERM sorting domain-containing protein [Gammaproteobacteria bacterium]
MNTTAFQAIDPTFFALFRSQALEDEINTKIFSGFGLELEVAAPTGGTVAVDDLSLEGPGLTVIGGSGFILRWVNPVEQVRIGFSDHKDNDDRTVRAYDVPVDYLRDPSQTSQSVNGNVIQNPTATAIDLAMGTVTSGSNLDLVVGGPGVAPISSVFVQTNKFLTSWLDVEFTPALIDPPSAVPLPASAWLFLSGMCGLFGLSHRRKHSAPG